MSGPVFDGPAPPSASAAEPTYKVLRVHKDGPLDVSFLANTVRSVYTHWVYSDETGQGDSQVCLQWVGECLNHELPLEWNGFIAVWDHKRRKRSVLRLAPKEYANIAAAIGADVNWQYRHVELSAVNKGDGRETAVRLLTHGAGEVSMEAHPIERSICLVLKIGSIPRQHYDAEVDATGRAPVRPIGSPVPSTNGNGKLRGCER